MAKGDYLGEFEQVVLLALVRLGEEAYGMSIHDEIARTTGRDVSVHAVYVTLSRLEKKGYVISNTGAATPERGGRAKKHYVIERPGREALERSRSMLTKLWAGVSLETSG